MRKSENVTEKSARLLIDLCRNFFPNCHEKQTVKTQHMCNYVAPQPEGSSPHSQEPANGPYPEKRMCRTV
jgi:hypothetical protein